MTNFYSTHLRKCNETVNRLEATKRKGKIRSERTELLSKSVNGLVYGLKFVDLVHEMEFIVDKKKKQEKLFKHFPEYVRVLISEHSSKEIEKNVDSGLTKLLILG